MTNLTEIDDLEIRVLVNDQLDNIAPSWHPEVQAKGMFTHVPLNHLDDAASQARGHAKLELHLPNSCCGVHGLSLMIVRICPFNLFEKCHGSLTIHTDCHSWIEQAYLAV